MMLSGKTGLGKTEMEQQLRQALFSRTDEDGNGPGLLDVLFLVFPTRRF
jgi:hypothetical protein